MLNEVPQKAKSQELKVKDPWLTAKCMASGNQSC